MAKKFKPKITKQINNLSRAINKIDSRYRNKLEGTSHQISEINPRINDVVYLKDGIERKVRYDQIENLSADEQASLYSQLSVDRFELRQVRAFEQLQEKGKISWQFKKSVAKDNPSLLEAIEEVEDLLAGNDKEAIKEEFSGQKLIDVNLLEEADSFFNAEGTPLLFDFYRPGEAGGFEELNIFTWNTYKVLKGI